MYHHLVADPHPGNVMVQSADGRPVLIDWGQCMELTRTQRRTLCELTLLLRTRCLPLIGAALQTQGVYTYTGGCSHARVRVGVRESHEATQSFFTPPLSWIPRLVRSLSARAKGFGFSTEKEGELAALVYFFFDSATGGPFQADILRMRDLVSKP